MRKLLACFAVGLISLMAACEETVRPSPDCPAPRPSSADTLHGQYTWTDNTGSVANTIIQFSAFQFRDDSFGVPTVFTMRVDTSVLAPQRRFNDLSATYRLLTDSLYIDTVTFQGGGGNSNVPSGLFLFACTPDSFLYLGGSTPGLSTADTVMRISIRR
jgi:hypothetical protein